MTDQPPEGHQPPGPAPQPPGPQPPGPQPQGPQPQPPQAAQPPYGPGQYAGAYGPTYANPPAPGLPSWAKTLFGFLIGLPVSIVAPILAFALVELSGPTELKVVLVTVIPPLLAAPLLGWTSTRPWGVGVMLGLAVGSFVLGGACVAIIDGSP